ncbi:MAG: hypothetical protein IIX59_05435 [Alistipes sp.]|nr:hypothetical protein [Alistipes sp.]MBQ2418623.1 hypothetical protein [Alistipes sp.]
MRFMRRDFWAIMRLGQLFISKSDNSQNEAAAKRLVYALADFLSPEDMENTVRMAGMLDFESSVATLSILGSEEQQWAKELIYSIATIDGAMNAEQARMWEYIENNTGFNL